MATQVLQASWDAARPVLEPGWAKVQPLVAPAWEQARPQLTLLAGWVDTQLSHCRPWQVALLSFVLALLVTRLLRGVRRLVMTLQDKGWKQVASGFLLDLPGVRQVVRHEKAKLTAKIRKDMMAKAGQNGGAAVKQLPERGLPPSEVRQRLAQKAKEDVGFAAEGDSRVSGTVYMVGEEHKVLLREAYCAFDITNPMHADVFPSVRKMETEVVAMTAALLGGGAGGDPGVCGSMTSGGTESILTAVKASRDYMAATRGITQPEMVIAVSAHAAFIKAAEYFNIRLVRLPVGKDYRLLGAAVRRAISSNTVLVVASCPGFPHGVMDHVQDIAQDTRRRGIPLHVDCCLGGFVLPFARQLGYPVPPFDFSVPGVTSMSVDTHKFGMAHKGTSVVLFRDVSIRRHQYTSITDWSGGLYISPGFAGSRSGALIATAWASLVHLGREGFLEATGHIMKAAKRFEAGVASIPGLEVIGSPEMCVIAFKSTRPSLNIYTVNDLLSRKGWHLNALQHPAALHICFTAAHDEAVADKLLQDLREAVEQVSADPKAAVAGGNAPLYGMAAVVPDRRIVGDFLVAYQDTLLEAL